MKTISKYLSQNSLFLIICTIVFVIAIFLRLSNLTDYLLYSDSYQALIVAQNLQAGHGLVGSMGDLGSQYPQYLGWTRPLFPLLISWTSSAFSIGVLDAARIISVVASIVIVPLAFWAVYMVFKNKYIALCGMILMASSYNAVFWGGMTLTEPLGLVLQFSLIIALGYYIRNSYYFAIPVGVILALCTAIRYEYALLVMPTLLTMTIKPLWQRPVVIATASMAGMLTSLYLCIRPFSLDTTRIVNSVKAPILLVIVLLIFILLIYIACLKYGKRASVFLSKLPIAVVCVTLSMALLVLTLIFVPALLSFMRDDFLLAITILIGSVMLFSRSRNTHLKLYGITAFLLLGSVYYLTNQDMERYVTHLIPLLLIPASYGLFTGYVLIKNNKKYPIVLSLVVAGLASTQLYVSSTAYTLRDNGIWKKQGYEQVAAQQSKRYTVSTNLMIVATPEPYRLYSNNDVSIRTLYRTAPYLYAGDIQDDTNVTIVNDAAMKYYFPQFYDMVKKNATQYQVANIHITEPLKLVKDVNYCPNNAQIYNLDGKQLNSLLTSSQ